MAKKKLTTDPTLAPRIQAALERGWTNAMACAAAGISIETFYQYMKIPEFSEMVIRAQQKALEPAVATFRSAFETQKANEVQIDEFAETRLDKNGQPYTYKKTTTRKKVIEHPPDWRAGEAYVKRRDPQNWSEKLLIEFDLNLEDVYKWAKQLHELEVSPSEAMEKLLQNIHKQKVAQNVRA